MPASYSHPWSILKAWKDWKIAHLSFGDADVCSEYELKRRAHYLGIPAAQLRWVSSYGPDPISLLERRMEALSLNPDDVAHIEPLTVRKLQQRCAKCEKSGQCALGLADEFADPGWQYWRDYCPNAATLSLLSTFQSCSKVYKESNRFGGLIDSRADLLPIVPCTRPLGVDSPKVIFANELGVGSGANHTSR